MTATNEPAGGPHPEDLLAPYALDTLTEEDSLQVESHLEDCSICRSEVRLHIQTAELLSQAVGQRSAPPGLDTRVMDAVGRVSPQVPAPEQAPSAVRFRFPWPQVLAPVAAAVVLVLAASLAMNLRFFSQVGQLTEVNSNLAARVLQLSTEDSDLLEFLQQEELASYLLANPSNEPLMLEPPHGGAGNPQGALLLAEDSRHAILLVSGMPQEPYQASYDVWLLRSDQRVRMGQVLVDSSGWGTMSFYYPPESVLRFDKVVLSRDDVGSGEAASRDMVLQGSIASLKSGR